MEAGVHPSVSPQSIINTITPVHHSRRRIAIFKLLKHTVRVTKESTLALSGQCYSSIPLTDAVATSFSESSQLCHTLFQEALESCMRLTDR
jgi:hypothetical protein